MGTLGEQIAVWASAESTVRALVLIGSRVRDRGPLAADSHSDWDFQVVTDRPEMFLEPQWLVSVSGQPPLAYVARTGRLGSAIKVTVVARGGELDLVVIPTRQLKQIKWLLRIGLASRVGRVREGLGHLAVVIRPGYRLVKGESEWGGFYRRVAAEFPSPRFGNAAVRRLAEGFVCDYVSTRHKIRRGEFVAAQRWLHHHLAEVNFQLLHELRQRRGETSLPDARRLESLCEREVTATVTVNALPTAESLLGATERAAAGCRELMHALVGDAWRWPDV